MSTSIKISKIIRDLLGGLSERQQKILAGRFGLNEAKPVTLARLGNSYNITRERVRQIESLSLDTIKKRSPNDDFRLFIELVKNYLKNSGGLKREDQLLADLRKLLKATTAPTTDNQMRFLLEASSEFSFSKETAATAAFWFIDGETKKKAAAFVKDLLVELKTRRKEIIEANDFKNVFAALAKKHNLTEEVALNYAMISRKFVKNAYDEHGLSSWREINPKTARDWAHLVLRKGKKPLHFTDIAKIVNDIRKDKKIHHQTIHNELIKDEKFVLVGKGMYGLKEFGLIPGTARDVIQHLIKKHGPLSPDELLDRILKERFVKPNTILINLQNRKHFERLDNGRYNIKAV
jgi:hypothetical protein